MTTYSNYEQRLLDQQSGAELDRLAARRAQRPTEERRMSNLTREEFETLLDEFANTYGAAVLAAAKPDEEYDRAVAAAVEARQALTKAVFP
jgi:hypothetical protein